MKAIIHITVVLMTMHFGAVEAIAQSAGRGVNDNGERSVRTNRNSRNVQQDSPSKQTVQNTERSRREPARTYTGNRTVNSSNKTRSTHVQRSNSPEKRNNTQYRGNSKHEKSLKTSTTNRHNPRSSYKKPEQNPHIGKTYNDPKGNSRQAVKHHAGLYDRDNYHAQNVGRYYPRKRVNVHVHPKTYHNQYRVLYYPAHREIVWTRSMYRDYTAIYPGYRWRYPLGYRINTISAFDAKYNIGEVSRVYGRVYGTWYNRETDDLLLFFGGEFPHQTFTMVIPGSVARRYSWKPERYFLGQHVFATGLISTFDGKPEMIIKRYHQLDVY